ncbi:MFS transporter [Streptomyces odontomachi]|uniref:MFS transporter n=1 Tax=Streptomyces odontomachi TaxID=2944940 RepID=UPI002109637A|nr:MFS transporter [Streptomyces sp. ODS25]
MQPTTTRQDTGAAVDRRPLVRSVVAAGIGNAIEWLDYAVYGYLAPTIGVLFFPSADPTASLLASFAVFGLTFAVRPLGALFFGSLGDRIGRQRTMAAVVVLISVSTFLIGVLPTHATLGVTATVILVLLRIGQGFSAGGETGNAYTFLTEYAPPGRRGLLTSMGNLSAFVGALFGSALVTVLYSTLRDGAMEAWGWRIPFLIAGPLGLVGLYLRMRLEDTPVFLALEERGAAGGAPLREALREHWRAVLRCGCIGVMHGVGFYMVLTYVPSFLAGELSLSGTETFLLTMVALLVAIVTLPLTGALSDRVGRRPVTIAGCVAYLVLSYPIFLLMSRGGVPGAVAALALLGVVFGTYAGTPFALMAELFPARVRVSGYSFGYNVFVALFGGTTPFIATYLMSVTGSQLAPAGYLMACAAMALVAVLVTPETGRGELRTV